ncbi:hypothetical protein D3C75_1049970 [compost metagenome]
MFSRMSTPRKLIIDPPTVSGSNLPPWVASAVTSLPKLSVMLNSVLLSMVTVYG